MLTFENNEKRNNVFFQAIREVGFLIRLDNKYYPSCKEIQKLQIKLSIDCILYDIVGLSQDKKLTNENINKFIKFKDLI